MSSSSEADAELARRRRKLEEDKLALEEEELQVKRLRLQREREALQPSSILRLNVGGQAFDTTRETIRGARSQFFGRLLEEREDGGVGRPPADFLPGSAAKDRFHFRLASFCARFFHQAH